MTQTDNTLPPEADTALDIPAVTDYQYDEMIVWVDRIWSDQLPNEVLYNKTPTYNQGATNNPSTIYACTRYGTTHSWNEMNANEWSDVKIDPIQQRVIALEKYGAVINRGDSLRSALQQAKDEWFIEWYAIVKTMYDIKHALAKWYCIYTGTSFADWKKTRSTGVFEALPAGSYGHAFCFIGYNEKWVIARNSYWSAYTYDGIEWSFLIRREDVKRMFTMYALIDKQDVDKIKLQKMKADAESKRRMVDMGIRNWQNENDPVTRWQVALMLDRLYQNMNK